MTFTDFYYYPNGYYFNKKDLESEIKNIISDAGKYHYVYKISVMEYANFVYVEWLQRFEGRETLWNSIKDNIIEFLEEL